MRRVLAVMAGVLAVLATTLLGAMLALFAPVFLDDRSLDRIVAVVALDWRDFGRERAEERLLVELDRSGIGPWVGDSTCVLNERDSLREVVCSWDTEVAIPLLDRRVPLSFGSRAALDAEGRLL